MSENYLRVLWTCGMGDACTNATRPGTHDEYRAASACCARVEDSEHGLITSSDQTLTPVRSDGKDELRR